MAIADGAITGTLSGVMTEGVVSLVDTLIADGRDGIMVMSSTGTVSLRYATLIITVDAVNDDPVAVPPAQSLDQTDVDADVVGATDVLHTRTKEYYFSLISKCHSPADNVS